MYLKGLTDQRRLLSHKGQTLDKHDYFEFMRKFNYNGVRFRKGGYISRDTLHHEWEWFRGKDWHKGAIKSKTGKVREKSAMESRKLKVK
jgi:hypothetical protein